MSRKANISATEKATFGRPRLYAVRAHYGPLDKQPDQFAGSTIILDDEENGVVRHAAAAQALCFDEDTTVVVLDVAALRRDIDAAAERTRDKKTRGRGKRGWQQALEAECKTRDVLGKDCGRPIAKALARLLMRAPTGATLVARGALAAVALKLALSRDAHAATCNVSRVVLVEPTLSAVAVNGLLACKTPPVRRITVDTAFADDDAQMRRGPAIAAACGEGISSIAPDDGGDAVLRAFLPRRDGDDDAEAAVEAAFGAEDSRGRRLRCAEVTVDMSPLTKQPETRFSDVSSAELLAAARGDDEADEPAAACDADDQGEARVAALVVRGGRCILARSLQTPKAWEGMRLPSAPAVAGADAVSGARRAIAAQLDIDIADQADQMAPLDNMPQLTLYRASGGTTNVVFMKALQPPVEPQEDYDLSDDEDFYDWYTLSRALPRVDPPTACLLRTAAFALHGAVEAGVVAKAWGGVFGDELVAAVTNAPAATPAPRVVGPCHDEANHEDACSCASDPFSC